MRVSEIFQELQLEVKYEAFLLVTFFSVQFNKKPLVNC